MKICGGRIKGMGHIEFIFSLSQDQHRVLASLAEKAGMDADLQASFKPFT